MKKSVIILSISALMVLVSSSYSKDATSYASSVKVFLNDSFLKTDVEPIIVDGRTLVPIRNIAEALGLSIEYNGSFNEVYIKTPDYTPSPIAVPDNIEDILNTIQGNNLLNLTVPQISRAVNIGKNLTSEEIEDYVYILPQKDNTPSSIDDLFGPVSLNTPFLEIIREANKDPNYSIQNALSYLKNYYLKGLLDFSFCIYGNGDNFYKNASISIIQDDVVIDKIYVNNFGTLNKAQSKRYANSYSGTVYFDFSKIDFSKNAILQFDYLDGIGKSFLIDFSDYT